MTKPATEAHLLAQIATLTTKRNELEDDAIATPCGRSRDDRAKQVVVINRQLLRLYGKMADLALAAEMVEVG